MYFLRKIIFHFPSRGLEFSGKRNIIFTDNTRKIMFQRDFFGKTIFLGHLEQENMVFRVERSKGYFSKIDNDRFISRKY